MLEQSQFKIPNVQQDANFNPSPELDKAAEESSAALVDAMAFLDEAQNLVGVLLASIEGKGDSRSAQAETVLRLVEQRIRQSHEKVDETERRHRNLFLAYFGRVMPNDD